MQPIKLGAEITVSSILRSSNFTNSKTLEIMSREARYVESTLVNPALPAHVIKAFYTKKNTRTPSWQVLQSQLSFESLERAEKIKHFITLPTIDYYSFIEKNFDFTDEEVALIITKAKELQYSSTLVSKKHYHKLTEFLNTLLGYGEISEKMLLQVCELLPLEKILQNFVEIGASEKNLTIFKNPPEITYSLDYTTIEETIAQLVSFYSEIKNYVLQSNNGPLKIGAGKALNLTEEDILALADFNNTLLKDKGFIEKSLLETWKALAKNKHLPDTSYDALHAKLKEIEQQPKLSAADSITISKIRTTLRKTKKQATSAEKLNALYDLSFEKRSYNNYAKLFCQKLLNGEISEAKIQTLGKDGRFKTKNECIYYMHAYLNNSLAYHKNFSKTTTYFKELKQTQQSLEKAYTGKKELTTYKAPEEYDAEQYPLELIGKIKLSYNTARTFEMKVVGVKEVIEYLNKHLGTNSQKWQTLFALLPNCSSTLEELVEAVKVL